ncbi:MAG: hypothetical protein OIF34_02215, partial [Porticoccaceae bacterium]|nr:hypothetical protein [Porticoccaceae bacterium]
MNLLNITKRRISIAVVLSFALSFSVSVSADALADHKTAEMQRLKAEAQQTLAQDVVEFNGYDGRPISDGPFNSTNVGELLADNAPYFLSPDEDFTEVFNYRWWMMSKHFRLWTDPDTQKETWVITEFFGWPGHGSLSGAIPCPAGHQFYDMRWFRDTKYLKSYIDFYMSGHGSKHNQREGRPFHSYIARPESHHFSSWMIDGTEAFLKVHPDNVWRDSLLPHMEVHQQVWDDKFRVRKGGSNTDGLYKVLDLYDGMEFTISASLPLVAGDGPYAIYTEKEWRNYYQGWKTIDQLRGSDHVKSYTSAFANAYPLVYLVRPSINSYYYANFKSLGNLYALKAEDSKDKADQKKSNAYLERAQWLQKKALDTLWHKDDQFFYSHTAADNNYGPKDQPSIVRESVGYTPWYFNMIPEGEMKYDVAWEQLSSPDGFLGKQGMTTAEKRHPYYNEQAYAWNGRGWPFQNSV